MVNTSKEHTDLENIQIMQLYDQGATVEQIAQALGKDPIALSLMLKSRVNSNRKLTLEERYGDLKDIAILALKEVAQYGESDSSRVAASKILIDEVDGNNGHTGGLIQFDYDKVAERLATATGRVNLVRDKIKLDKLNPSPIKSDLNPAIITDELEFTTVST